MSQKMVVTLVIEDEEDECQLVLDDMITAVKFYTTTKVTVKNDFVVEDE
jgi:hypothetical protein